MKSMEKIELLKDTIEFMYCKEERSKIYISKVLFINRKNLTQKIQEWGLVQNKSHHHVRPSTQKYINSNRNFIKARLDKNISVPLISQELKVGKDFLLKSIILNDEVLTKAYKDYSTRLHQGAELNRQKQLECSSRNYYEEDLEGEVWKTIMGYPQYEVSSCGRVRHYNKRLKKYYLLSFMENDVNPNRLYVALYNTKEGKTCCKVIMVARLVGFHFLEGYDDIEANTINHKDGNPRNNRVENLEWVSQSDNNKHAYRVLKRPVVNHRKYNFKKILYQNKYEFKTVEAFVKFLGKSPTQTRRYMNNPERYGIQFIK